MTCRYDLNGWCKVRKDGCLEPTEIPDCPAYIFGRKLEDERRAREITGVGACVEEDILRLYAKK